jgi:hypothetical protein
MRESPVIGIVPWVELDLVVPGPRPAGQPPGPQPHRKGPPAGLVQIVHFAAPPVPKGLEHFKNNFLFVKHEHALAADRLHRFRTFQGVGKRCV